MEVAYCTNVVAGGTLDEMRSNVERIFVPVRAALDIEAPLPLGLWLSARAADELARQPGGARALCEHLAERGLVVTTLNAFPYHHFHAAVVKRAVYEPNWADARRLLYTMQLADLLVDLLPPGVKHASISTLPLGWRPVMYAQGGGAALGVAGAHLQQLALHCARLEERTGVRVHVDLEPEPGCALDTAQDVVQFFERALPAPRQGLDPRRYIGVCHDVCHAAVMFERQDAVLTTYRQAGIRVGKVQISNAPVCSDAPDELAVLASFAEPRYLHQACVRNDGAVQFFEDLPLALAAAPVGEWRTHFHVPVFAHRLGALGTTQSEIDECLRTIAPWPAEEQPQIEVETYAWEVLPAQALEGHDLSAGIAAELRWTRQRLDAARLAAGQARG